MKQIIFANFKFIDKFSFKNNDDIKTKYKLSNYIANFIYGNICCVKSDDGKNEFILISRRRIFNYKIKNYHRGLNKYGNLSNEKEHECIFILNNDKIYSFVILSGNIPAYYDFKSGKKNNKFKIKVLKLF